MPRIIILLILLILTPNLSSSQNLNLSKISEISISGTSTLHDWTMTVEEYTGSGDFIIEGHRVKDINSLTVTIDPESLKSGKTGMDKNAYKALETDKHRNIIFTLTETKNISTMGKLNLLQVKGDLSVAGNTKTIGFTVRCEVEGKDKVICSGNKDMKMTDFGVEPPTAMFGTIKTGDEINVNFKVEFSN